MKIMAVYEIEKLARQLIEKNNRGSAWPLLFVIELSKQSGYSKALNIFRDLKDRKQSSFKGFLKPVSEYLDISRRSERGSQYPTIYAKLKTCFDLVDIDSFEGKIATRLMERTLLYLRFHSSATPLACLFNLALSVRKLTLTTDVYEYLDSGAGRGKSADNIIRNMQKLGLIEVIKQGDYRKAKALIFEVQ